MHSTGVIDPAYRAGHQDPWTGLDLDLLRRVDQVSPPTAATSWRSPPPCRATGLTAFGKRFPDRLLRRRHRRAARDDVCRRPGDGWPAPGGGDLLDLPEPGVRPDHDGRRTAQAAGDVGAATVPASPVPTAPATTACGICRCWTSCPACGWPHRATAPGSTRNSARRWTSDGPTALRFPKGDVGEDIPALERRDGIDVLAVPAEGLSDERTAGGGGTVRVDGEGRRRAAAQPGHRRDGGRPAMGAAGACGDRSVGDRARAGGHVGGQRC